MKRLAPKRPRTARASAQGRASAKRGNQAEDELDRLHALCRARGIANVRRAPTPLKIIGRAPRGLLCVYAERQGADCRGWMADGRPVVVESKSCAVDRFYLSEVRPDQREDLESCHAAGGVALLVIRHTHPPLGIYAFRWAEVRQRTRIDLDRTALPALIARADYLAAF